MTIESFGGKATLGANTFTGAQTFSGKIVTQNSLSAIQLGGSSASEPALGRSGLFVTAVQADEGDYAPMSALYYVSGTNKALAAGGSTAHSHIKFSSTANFGVFVGSGAPTISAAKGSLYLRSDGSSTSTRAYIATDSAGTWTAITTAA